MFAETREVTHALTVLFWLIVGFLVARALAWVALDRLSRLRHRRRGER